MNKYTLPPINCSKTEFYAQRNCQELMSVFYMKLSFATGGGKKCIFITCNYKFKERMF